MSLFLFASIFSILGIVIYSCFIEPRWVRYTKLIIPVEKGIRPEGLSILHLSDLHFKRWDARKMRTFRMLEKKTYDLILITGDMIDDFHGNQNALKALAGLRSRHGIFCVFGNHEYLYYCLRDWFDIFILHRLPGTQNPRLDEFAQGLKKLGITHLANQNLSLKDLGVTLVGVEDLRAGMALMEKALTQVPQETFNILLVHHPDSLLVADPKKIDLALCGHTHGGQIRIPFLGALFTDSALPKHLARGRVRIQGIDTYVSTGLSHSRVAVGRLLCRPEITEIFLSGRNPT